MPTFPLVVALLPDLKLAHGSCRKTNGPDFDALAWLGDVIADNFNKPNRPQQLFLSGDQIYADEVASPLLPVVNALAFELIGGAESRFGLNGSEPPCGRLNFDAVAHSCRSRSRPVSPERVQSGIGK